jgi:hypothetical protein
MTSLGAPEDVLRLLSERLPGWEYNFFDRHLCLEPMSKLKHPEDPCFSTRPTTRQEISRLFTPLRRQVITNRDIAYIHERSQQNEGG